MDKPYTIVFTGKMRSGKDQSAAFIMEARQDFCRMALADKLKEATASALGITLQELEEQKHRYRRDLILVGKAARYLNPNIWIESLDKNILFNNNIVLTDARFQNEFNYFDDSLKTIDLTRVILVRIRSAESDRIARGAQPEFFNDQSETELDKLPDSVFDVVIENNGTLDELKAQIQELILNKLD